MAPRRISQKGIDLIKRFEGLRLTAYLCPAGVPTIGYGHTASIKKSDVGKLTITPDLADKYLRDDVQRFENYVNGLNPNLNQNQFDALVSLAFNVGSFGSGLRPLIQDNNLWLVPKKMLEYNKVNGRVSVGLDKRRTAEVALFTTPVNE